MKKILDIPLRETCRLNHHTWELLLKALEIASPGTSFRCSNRIFCTFSLISGERCERKLLRKNPGIPLTETYRSSDLTNETTKTPNWRTGGLEIRI